MICKKCEIPMETKGCYAAGMFLDWWECPNCDSKNEDVNKCDCYGCSLKKEEFKE